MTKKENGARGAAALEPTRELFETGCVPVKVMRAAGFPVDGTATTHLTQGDPRALEMVLHAGRAPGFGERPIDEAIRRFLDGAYGRGRWQKDRPPHPWEPHDGGDVELAALTEARERAVAAREEAELAFWKAKDEGRALRGSMNYPLMAAAGAAVDRALAALEAALTAERAARGAESRRASQIARSLGVSR